MCNHRWAWPIARETFSPDTNHDGCPNPFFRGGLSLLFAKCQQASVEARKRLSLVRGERRGKGIDSRPGVSIVSPHPGRPLCVLSINLRQITFPLKPLERKKKKFCSVDFNSKAWAREKNFFPLNYLEREFSRFELRKKNNFFVALVTAHLAMTENWFLPFFSLCQSPASSVFRFPFVTSM